MKSELLKAIALGVGIKFLADESRDVITWLPKKLIKFDAKRLPEDLRERMEEEWIAHCNDLPGSVAKCLHGIGCVLASFIANDSLSEIAIKITLYPITEFYGFLQVVLCKIIWLVNVKRAERHFYGSGAWAKSHWKRSGGLIVLGLAEKMENEISLHIRIPSIAHRLPDSKVYRIIKLQCLKAFERWLGRLSPFSKRNAEGFSAIKNS